jgi:tagatose-6-phosphate ketose/aldose isomerase
VIFTGAGTSQYVGDVLAPYLTERWAENGSNGRKITFESIASTSIVAAPLQYLRSSPVSDKKVLLVSFGRSGNSPESIAAVNIANQVLGDNLAHVFITCAPDGKLAEMANQEIKTSSTGTSSSTFSSKTSSPQTSPDNTSGTTATTTATAATASVTPTFLFLTPSLSNDQGFAMTSSFTCMLLSAALIFEPENYSVNSSKSDNLGTIESWVNRIAQAGKSVVAREVEIQDIVNRDFNRIVYLGSGALAGLAREAQLKILELTSGQIATIYDSSMGFRHGPKSFIDRNTLVFGFVSSNPYTRLYDLDVLEEIKADGIASEVYTVGSDTPPRFSGAHFGFKIKDLPDLYLALPDIMFAQTLAVMASLKVKNTPDTPSKTGTVNRVVKGVTIHDYTI